MSIEPSIILIGVVVLIVAFGVYVLFYRKQRLSGREVQQIRSHWKEIQQLASTHPDQAVLKADKLLDHALKKAGYSGSMADKMRAARSVFNDNNGLWSAHKLRNRIAHEIDIQVTKKQSQGALQQFKQAFFDLGIDL